MYRHHGRARGSRFSRGGRRNEQTRAPAAVSAAATATQNGDHRKGNFAKQGKMPTAKFQVYGRRQMVAVTKKDEYMGTPPPGLGQFEAQLVLPNNHLVPIGLDEPSALDAIRKAYQVWITRTAPNILMLQTDSIVNLQDAFNAVNWAIHEMRLPKEDQGNRIIVQRPTGASIHDMITIQTGSRPYIPSPTSPRDVDEDDVPTILPDLFDKLAQSFGAMLEVEKHLRMRVHFGQLLAHRKRRAVDDRYSYDELCKMASVWSRRGGAGIETRLPDAQLATKTVKILTDPERGLRDHEQDVQTKCVLTLLVPESKVLKAGITILQHGNPQISNVEIVRTESTARLNWTVAAPDLRHDWNLRVDALEIIEQPPKGIQNLLQTQIKLKAAECPNEDFHQRFPTLHVVGNIREKLNVSSTQLKMSTVIPLRNSPYAVEVSTTRFWKGLEVTGPPDRESWGVEVYGLHWEEAMNYVKPGESKKDWGEGLRFMWPGEDPTLEARYANFLGRILEIQKALEEAHVG